MSNIAIYRRPREDGHNKTGLGRYADTVESKIDTEYDVCPVNADLKSGLMTMIKDGLFKPTSFAIKNRKKISISHATDELCSIPLLFSRGRKIVTMHHVVKKGESSDIYRAVWKIITMVGLRCADNIIAISDETKRDLMDMGICESKIIHITNEINPIFRLLDTPKKKMVGCVCELIPRKNVKATIDAFNALHEMDKEHTFSLHICGDGVQKAELMEHIKNLGLSEYIVFHSRLDDDELVRFYNECMAIFNTSTHEGLGITTIEAQRCGTPVFHIHGTDIPPEVLKESVPCQTVEEMGHKAFALMNDSKTYTDLRNRSIEYANGFGADFTRKYLDTLYGKD